MIKKLSRRQLRQLLLVEAADIINEDFEVPSEEEHEANLDRYEKRKQNLAKDGNLYKIAKLAMKIKDKTTKKVIIAMLQKMSES